MKVSNKFKLKMKSNELSLKNENLLSNLSKERAREILNSLKVEREERRAKVAENYFKTCKIE